MMRSACNITLVQWPDCINLYMWHYLHVMAFVPHFLLEKCYYMEVNLSVRVNTFFFILSFFFQASNPPGMPALAHHQHSSIDPYHGCCLSTHCQCSPLYPNKVGALDSLPVQSLVPQQGCCLRLTASAVPWTSAGCWPLIHCQCSPL